MLVHRAPDGLRRCREKTGACPYGGPVGQTLSRARKNTKGEVGEKPKSDLPLVSMGNSDMYEKAIARVKNERGMRGSNVSIEKFKAAKKEFMNSRQMKKIIKEDGLAENSYGTLHFKNGKIFCRENVYDFSTGSNEIYVDEDGQVRAYIPDSNNNLSLLTFGYVTDEELKSGSFIQKIDETIAKHDDGYGHDKGAIYNDLVKHFGGYDYGKFSLENIRFATTTKERKERYERKKSEAENKYRTRVSKFENDKAELNTHPLMSDEDRQKYSFFTSRKRTNAFRRLLKQNPQFSLYNKGDADGSAWVDDSLQVMELKDTDRLLEHCKENNRFPRGTMMREIAEKLSGSKEEYYITAGGRLEDGEPDAIIYDKNGKRRWGYWSPNGYKGTAIRQDGFVELKK